MKEEFIRFLKDRRAWIEFKEEIHPVTVGDLDAQFKDGGAMFLLCDGCLFFWKNAKTEVDWEQMNTEWTQLTGGMS